MLEKLYRFFFIDHFCGTFRALYFLMFPFVFFKPLLIAEFIFALFLLAFAFYGEKKGWNKL